MKFRAGNIVRTLKSAGLIDAGSIGKVMSVSWIDVLYPYEVEFASGETRLYYEGELEPASAGEAMRYHFFVEGDKSVRIPMNEPDAGWEAVGKFIVSDEEFTNDPVEHPSHYTSHPSGVECIQITEHMSFTLGNAVKYIWRADLKDDAVEDLKKARFYINREIEKRERA